MNITNTARKSIFTHNMALIPTWKSQSFIDDAPRANHITGILEDGENSLYFQTHTIWYPNAHCSC